jgi:hypothetical protein
MTYDNLWIDDGRDILLEDDDEATRLTKRQRRARAKTQPGRHFGCPWWWLKEVYAAARSKGDLAVGIWLWRTRVVRRSRTVRASGSELVELGISRFTRYRSLRRFAEAGLIALHKRDGKAAIVTIRDRSTGAHRDVRGRYR